MKSRHMLRLVARIALALMAFGAVVVIATTLFIVSRFGGNAEPPADCAVVFGAAVYGNLPGASLIRRIHRADDLYHQGMVKKLFLTGGKSGDDPLSEAEAMKRIALRDGVPSAAIVLEERARSTWENILFTRPLTGSCATIVGISDEYHLARIELLAGRQGWGSLQTLPATERPAPAMELRNLFRESIAYIYYALHIDQMIALTPKSQDIQSIMPQEIVN